MITVEPGSDILEPVGVRGGTELCTKRPWLTELKPCELAGGIQDLPSAFPSEVTVGDWLWQKIVSWAETLDDMQQLVPSASGQQLTAGTA